MAQKTATAEDYMARLQELGEKEDHINRFYLAITDEPLLDMEERLIEEDKGLDLHAPVLTLYRQWREEMGAEKWAEVWAHNESCGDADRNWLVSEEMGEDSELVRL